MQSVKQNIKKRLKTSRCNAKTKRSLNKKAKMRCLCKSLSFKMELVRHVISAIAKAGGATQDTGLGGEPTQFAVLKDFVIRPLIILVEIRRCEFAFHRNY